MRNQFNHYNIFTPGWYGRYPRAWNAGAVSAAAWTAASWASMNSWLSFPIVTPYYYDYGNTIVYDGGSVYYSGKPAGTVQQYYDRASSLACSTPPAPVAPSDATTTAAPPAADAGQWLPLGVFSLTEANEKTATMVFQLAVNKEGTVRGNYVNTASNVTQPVSGAVDKKSQKVAWVIGDNKNTVVETGLYNLTQDQAPALLHIGKDTTKQCLLVRLNQDEAKNKATPTAPPQ